MGSYRPHFFLYDSLHVSSIKIRSPGSMADGLLAPLHQTAMKANSGTVFITVWELKYLEDTQINIFFFYGPFLMAFIKVEKSIYVLSILTLML